LFKWCTICYGIILVFLFYPFVSRIKIAYNFFSKARQVKQVIVSSYEAN